MTAARNVTGFEMWSYALPGARTLGSVGSLFMPLHHFRTLGSVGSVEALKCGAMPLPGARTLGSVGTLLFKFFFGLLSFQCLGLQRLWSFKIDSPFPRSANFSRFGDKRIGSSMLFDKGLFNYCFGFVDLKCVSNVRFPSSCQTSIRWGVTE